MPIYEYQCHSCSHVTEALQKFSDPPLGVCPKCGGVVSKLMSMNSFHLKGSGWYVTDYAGKNAGSVKADKAEKTEKVEKTENKTASCSSSDS